MKTIYLFLNLLVLSACQTSTGGLSEKQNLLSSSIYGSNIGLVTDSDWNVKMYQGCNTIKPEIKKLEENGNSFIRVTLDEDSGTKACASDGKWGKQRAEIQSKERMLPGHVWEYTANVRFNNMIDSQVIFMQIHSKTGKGGWCYSENGITSTPPIKLRMLNGLSKISVEPGGYPNPKYRGTHVDVRDMFTVGDWTEVKIVLDLHIGESFADLYIDGKQIMNKLLIGTPNSCIQPWGKLGLYRAPWNILWTEQYQKTKDSFFANKFEPLSVDYDKVTLKKLAQ